MRSEIELRLPPEPIAPILARAAVTAIGSGLPPSVVSDAELLTSEVVSNAVKHADLDPSQKIVLRVVMDERLRIEVADPGPPFEADLRRQGSGTGGWGLFLIEAIATSWGVEPEGVGKKVWFELGAAALDRST
jgi:anti-sigma regulatory factor (Ser/Thr protein kinase)